MARSKASPPRPKPSPRELVANAETSRTETTPESEVAGTPRRYIGETVEAPSPELFPSNKPDWGKIGVYTTIVLFVIGALLHYSDLNATVRNISEDVREVKRKFDDLFQRSVENSVRIGGVEQRLSESREKPNAPQTPSTPKKQSN